MSKKITIKTLPDEEYFVGHKGCGGCGGSLVLRWTLKALGEKSYVVVPAGCMSAIGFIYPQMAFGVNAIISPFAATGAMLSGIAAVVRAKGLNDVHVIGFAGDGATADIGLQSLSGALDRREKIIYICYDNEAYMNTGVQRSGATPVGARTTTSPSGRPVNGPPARPFGPTPPPAGAKKVLGRPGDFLESFAAAKKDLVRIAAAHNIPFAATASVGHPADFLRKLERASQIDGPSFLHVFAPCPTGWGCPTDSTIDLGKSVVDTGLWPLVEWDHGVVKINRKLKNFAPLETYFDGQARFARLTADDKHRIASERDRTWAALRAWERETTMQPPPTQV